MINHDISISITDYKKTLVPLEIKAHDYGKHILNFEIGDIEFDYAVLKLKRHDGEVISYNLEGTNFVLGGSELDKSGYVAAEISFYDNNGRITTNTFEFCVLPDIDTNDEIEKDPKKPILDQLIEDVTEAEKQRDEAEKQRDEKIGKIEKDAKNYTDCKTDAALKKANEHTDEKISEINFNQLLSLKYSTDVEDKEELDTLTDEYKFKGAIVRAYSENWLYYYTGNEWIMCGYYFKEYGFCIDRYRIIPEHFGQVLRLEYPDVEGNSIAEYYLHYNDNDVPGEMIYRDYIKLVVDENLTNYAKMTYVDTSIQQAILDSWEAEV